MFNDMDHHQPNIRGKVRMRKLDSMKQIDMFKKRLIRLGEEGTQRKI